MANAAAHSEGERALVELGSKLAAVSEADLIRPGTDPHSAAVTALLVSDFLTQPEHKAELSKANVTVENAHELARLARAILVVVDRLGGDYLPDAKGVPGDLVQRGTTVRTTITGALEKALPNDAAVRTWLEAIRLGAGVVDLVYDLRTLADFCEKNQSAQAASAALGAVAMARSAADALEFALRTGETVEQGKSRGSLARLWTMFVPAYERAREAGHAIATAEGRGREHDFPSLALIASHRRARRRPVSLVPPRSKSEPPGSGAHGGTETSRLAQTAKTPKFEPDAEPPRAEPLVPASGALPPTPPPTGPVKPASVNLPPPARPVRTGPPTTAPAVRTGPPNLPGRPAVPKAPTSDVDLDNVEIIESVDISRSAPPAKLVPEIDLANVDIVQSVEIVRSDMPPTAAKPPSVPPSSWAEHRRETRQTVEIEVGIASQSNFYLGFTENLSSGGVFVATYARKPIGDRLEIALTFPTGEELRVPGTVRWLREPSSDGWPGLGVQFDALSEEDEKKIRKFLSMRDPLFYDD